MIKQCKICGLEFKPTYTLRKYCSLACSRQGTLAARARWAVSEKNVAYHQRYHADNSEMLAAKSRAYQQAHPDRRRAQQQRYRIKHLAELAAKARATSTRNAQVKTKLLINKFIHGETNHGNSNQAPQHHLGPAAQEAGGTPD